MAGRSVVIVGTLIFTGDEHLEHPIVLPPPGQQPPGVPTFPIWGPPGTVFPPKPGYPPVAGHPLPPQYPPVDPGYGYPEHPVDPGYGIPSERPEHPIYYPPGTRPHPEHPIFYPPHIWGPTDPRPTPPIYIPPPSKPVNPGDPAHPINKPPMDAPPGYEWRFVYLPFFGGWAWVLVPISGDSADGPNIYPPKE